MQGILNEREADGQTQYKVRFKGLGKEDDAWVSASEVGTKQVSNFQLRKAKKGGEGLIPVKTIFLTICRSVLSFLFAIIVSVSSADHLIVIFEDIFLS